jgi:hypothetical protein
MSTASEPVSEMEIPMSPPETASATAAQAADAAEMSTADEILSDTPVSAPETRPASAPQAADAVEPEPLKIMKALAVAGDLAGLLDAFIKYPKEAADFRQIRTIMRAAIRQASKQSPRRFTRAIYREATAFLAYVQMRLHTYVVLALADVDRQSQPRLEAPSDELMSKILPQVERLMRLTMELNQSWATTYRLWRLARRGGKKKQIQHFNDWYDDQVAAGILPELYTG